MVIIAGMAVFPIFIKGGSVSGMGGQLAPDYPTAFTWSEDTFNRTYKELKRDYFNSTHNWQHPFNRTYKELKLIDNTSDAVITQTFNRTYKELKPPI